MPSSLDASIISPGRQPHKHAIGLLCALSALLLTQGQASEFPLPSECACAVTDSQQHPQFTRFERVLPATQGPIGGYHLEAAKGTPVVWLRLHNNTTCPIVLSMSHMYFRLEGGRNASHVLDGEPVDVCFYVEDPAGKERISHCGGHTFGMARLPGGFSLLFGVPAEYFRKGYLVSVPFIYEWEGAVFLRSRGVRREVVYGPDELPASVQKELGVPSECAPRDDKDQGYLLPSPLRQE